MLQDSQFCYAAPSLRVIECYLKRSVLGVSQIQKAREDDYGEF